MRFLRNKRRLVALGALGALVAVTLFVVFPAFASNPGDTVLPASTAGVAPYDVPIGGTGDCGNLFTGTHALGAVSEYDNVNPKTKKGLASGHNDGVTFDLTLGSNAQGQTLAVVGHGAAILGIGIKGGSESTAYDYRHSIQAGYVASDSALHAPAQAWTSSGTTETGTNFFSISQLSVCYTVLKYIEGTVYQDNNQTGGNDTNPAPSDTPLAGWTVNLYSGVNAGTPGGGALVASQQTPATGAYHFDIPAAANTTYRVCEVPSGTPAQGAWVESQPMPSTATLCNGNGEAPKGYDVPSAQLSKSNANFGNVGGFACSGEQVGLDAYSVGTCKEGQQYVFNSGTTGNGAPFVDYWVGDPNPANMKPAVEKINFDDPFDASNKPQFTTLLYADGGGFPPVFNNLVTMPYCQLDPRDQYGNDGFTLNNQYTTVPGSTAVFPTTNPATTSCVISIKIVAPVTAGGVGKLQAFVYALGDSVRVGN